MTRPTFDEFYLEIAKALSLRANCTRSKVGAVLVSEDHRCSLGYNDSPPGEPGCLSDNACPRGRLSYEELPALQGDYKRNCIAIHAERDALLRANPEIIPKSTIYVTRSPCRDCFLLAAKWGVSRFVWLTPDNNVASLKIY